MQHLKLALLQVEIVWKNVTQNRMNYSEKINELSETVDIIVLPSWGINAQPFILFSL